MGRVLDLKALPSGFESHSVLALYTLDLCCFSRVGFVFEHDIDLEPVKINSTTSRGICRVHKLIFFIFINLGYSP